MARLAGLVVAAVAVLAVLLAGANGARRLRDSNVPEQIHVSISGSPTEYIVRGTGERAGERGGHRDGNGRRA